MSLAEVADKGRQTILHRVQNQAYAAAMLEILRDIEADPDFTLRERLEALATNIMDNEMNLHPGNSCDRCDTLRRVSIRLRSLLEAKP